jgi:hypothetical protein
MKEKEGVNTRISTHRRDAICLFQTASAQRERETERTIYTKLYQTERRKKKWIFRQKSC